MPTRIGCWSARSGAVSRSVRGQLNAAAAALGDGVQIVSLGDGPTPGPLDAVIVIGPPHSAADSGTRAPWRTDQPNAPLILALAPNDSAGEHVRLLGHDADVVLPATTHGRVILATVLALLRWRAR
jgi:DNA-binding response OmpR family regulator